MVKAVIAEQMKKERIAMEAIKLGWMPVLRYILERIPTELRDWKRSDIYRCASTTDAALDNAYEWLRKVIDGTKSGIGLVFEDGDQHVENYGFANIREAAEQFRILKKAWDGLITVHVHVDGLQLRVSFLIARY